MRTLPPILLLGLVAFAARAQDDLPSPPDGKTWKLVWHDEIGTWGGHIAKAELPDRFLVDYVRVYDLVGE